MLNSMHSTMNWSNKTSMTKIMRLSISGIALILFIDRISYVAANETRCYQNQCSVHEVYNDCGTYWFCERTCDQPEGRPCPKICVPGCFCETNYIRENANGTCIQTDACAEKL